MLVLSAFDVSFDNTLYLQLARNLADGYGFVGVPNGESVLWRTPGYPAVLMAVMLVFGKENFLAIVFLQAMIDATTGLLLFLLGKKLGSVSMGIMASVFYVLYPLGAYYTLRGQPESLFGLVFVAVVSCVWYISVHRNQPSLWWFGFLGLLIGIAALIKAVALLLVPICLVVLLVHGKVSIFKRLLPALAVVTAFGLTVSPWTVRNYLVTGHFVPVATGGGYSLWVGYNHISGGREDGELQEPALGEYIAAREKIAAPFRVNEAEKIVPPGYMEPVHISPGLDAAFKVAAKEGIAENIPGALMLVVKKIHRLWFSIFQTKNQWAQIYIYILQIPIVVFAMIGVISFWRAGIRTSGLWLPVLGLTLAYGLIVSTLRYSMPLMAIVLLLSAQGFILVFSRWFARIGVYPAVK